MTELLRLLPRWSPSRWPVAAALAWSLLAGCADPVGVPKPLPLDAQEAWKASDVYHRNAGRLNGMDGVYSTYLTTHNNPRRIVVVVRDNGAQANVEKVFGTSLEGVKLDYQLAARDVADDGGIEAVPTVDLPDTWWGRFLYTVQRLCERFTGVTPPESAPAAQSGDKQL